MKKNKFVTRVTVISAVFAIICLIYAVRLISIRINASPDVSNGEYFKRREVIQALRGEIYDRNGVKLVSNKYTQDLVFNYSAMSGDRHEQNTHLLKALSLMQECGEQTQPEDSSFPFAGEYPNYTYLAEALDEESNLYFRLLKRIAENELEDECPLPKDQLTASYLEGFYKDQPDAFPSERELVRYYLEKYKLVDKDTGQLVFSNQQTDMLLRVRYNMEVADFSVYVSFTLAHDVNTDLIAKISELSIPGAAFETRTERVYEFPGYASHILGRTGEIQAKDWEYYKELGYEMDDIVGLDGCEAAFEQYLRGVDGVRLVTEDADGNIVDSSIEQEAVPGKDIYLTIDIMLQIEAEDGLASNVESNASAESGAVVAMDPNNGQVLVLASYPTYDLSTFGVDFGDLSTDATLPLFNRALQGVFAPGSTFKLGMAALGLESGTVKADTRLLCDGIYTAVGGHHPKCWIYNSVAGGGKHGELNASGAIAVSCNCYFYELGRLMGIHLMNEFCSRLGLGESTGIQLPEKTGMLAGPEYRDQTDGVVWSEGDTILAAIGQAENAFTPMQLASYACTLMNGGTRYSATLLYKVSSFSEGGDVDAQESKVIEKIDFKDSTISTIKLGMQQMVEQSSTASWYFRNIPVTVGGKTGTAELGGNTEENGLFVCTAPLDKPEIVVVSVIEHAGGGSYAVPAAASVLTAYYGV